MHFSCFIYSHIVIIKAKHIFKTSLLHRKPCISDSYWYLLICLCISGFYATHFPSLTKTRLPWASEMAEWLTVSTTLAKNSGSVSSIHMAAYSCLYYHSRDPVSSSSLCGCCIPMMYINDAGAYTYIHINKT